MSPGEIAVLTGIIAAFALFAVTLAWAAHEQARPTTKTGGKQ